MRGIKYDNMGKPAGFKDIKGYEKLYAINCNGDVWSYPKKYQHKGRLVVPVKNWAGYKRIQLHKDKKSKIFSVHRLVALMFIKNPKKLPCVNHKNGKKEDNRHDNLEWCTIGQNNKHSYDKLNRQRPVGSKHPATKLTEKDVIEIRKMAKIGVKRKKIAEKFGVAYTTIHGIIKKYNWKHI
jgi:hypothetical protein